MRTRILVSAVLAVGIALRLAQYLANASLWVDEAAVARNILDRSAFDLLGALDYGQIAPYGFLLVEKIATIVFGPDEHALRLFPLLCGIVSLPLFYIVTIRILNPVGAVVAVVLFALGIPFVYFPSQVKPYSGDIAAGLIVLALALEIRLGASTRRFAVAALAGAAIPWFSYGAMFVMTGIGLALVALALVQREKASDLRPTLTVVAIWAIAVIAAAVAARHSTTPADREFMQRYWSNGFPAGDVNTLHRLLWPWKQIRAAFAVFGNAPPALDGGLHYRWPLVFLALAAAGIWSLWRRGPEAALFVVLPVFAAVAAAMVRVYPYSGRVSVSLTPFLLISVAAAIADAERMSRSYVRRASLIVPAAAVLVAANAIAVNAPPDRQEDIRSVLAYTRERFTPSDRMYVYYGAGQAFLYYASRYGFTPDQYVVASCSRHEPRAYLKQLDDFRGRSRVWTIFSHSMQNGREIRLATTYLDRIGHRVDQIPATAAALGAGSYGFLYDLSDARRLTNASGDTYPVPADIPDSSWLCYGTMTPVRSR